MTDITPPLPEGFVLRTYWFQRPDGEIVQMESTQAPEAVDIPDGWTLLPPEVGARRWQEQEQHKTETHARALADAANEQLARNHKRMALLERITGVLNRDAGPDEEPLTVEDVADTLGVPVPGQAHLAGVPAPMVDHVDPSLRAADPVHDAGL